MFYYFRHYIHSYFQNKVRIREISFQIVYTCDRTTFDCLYLNRIEEAEEVWVKFAKDDALG